jgi:hypothetical protein
MQNAPSNKTNNNNNPANHQTFNIMNSKAFGPPSPRYQIAKDSII